MTAFSKMCGKHTEKTKTYIKGDIMQNLGLVSIYFRKISPERIIEEVKRKIPDITLTTDIIVGFPGETDADFESTMELLKKEKIQLKY